MAYTHWVYTSHCDDSEGLTKVPKDFYFCIHIEKTRGVFSFFSETSHHLMATQYYTAAGLQKLKDELHHMKTVERPRISAQIAEARDKGDLSENAEYDAAKEAQGLLEARIAKIGDLIANARLVDESQVDASRVYILSKVKIRNMQTKALMEYTLVAENEANLVDKKISVDSPIGKGLLGKKVGEIAEVNVPAGKLKFEVVEISR